MRRRLLIAVGAAALLSVGLVAGPRPSVDPPRLSGARQAVPAAPGEVEAWLEATEHTVPGIVEGAEKAIRWAGAPGARTELSLVYVHGYSASAPEIEPVMARLGERLHANVHWTRLAGHGRDGEALASATATDWLEDVAEAVQVGETIGDEVVLVGTSTGGTLAAVHALHRPEGLRGLVVLSPNLGPKNQAAELLLWPWLSVLLPPALGERDWQPTNAEQARYWTHRYPHTALVPMMALVDHARRQPWSELSVPTLVIANPADPVVDGGRIRAWTERLPRDTVTVIEADRAPDEEQHVLAGDILAPAHTEAMVDTLAEAIEAW